MSRNGEDSTARQYIGKIDHIAVAVPDLQASINFYRDVLGFEIEREMETKGEYSGMLSAVMKSKDVFVVLLQGKQPDSQISRFVEQHGPGVQHIAFEVDDLDAVYETLSARGQEFVTGIINGPGLRQLFAKRDPVSGVMLEYVQRTGNPAFSNDNVQELFRQMERSNAV